jgi:RsiG-like
VELLPDLATISDADLRALVKGLRREEHSISYRRRILHGKIDLLCAELVSRLQNGGGTGEWPEVREPRRPTKPSLEGAARAAPE